MVPEAENPCGQGRCESCPAAQFPGRSRRESLTHGAGPMASPGLAELIRLRSRLLLGNDHGFAFGDSPQHLLADADVLVHQA
jgi:hypothetical protein